MSRLITLSPKTLSQTLAAAPGGLVLLFSSERCGPCRAFKPVVERVVAQSGGDLTLLLVDAYASTELAAQYSVRSIPTLVCFRDGEQVDQRAGSMPEPKLRAMLRDVGVLGP